MTHKHIDVYLAWPLTHESPRVMEERVLACMEVYHALKTRGLVVYPPIVVTNEVRKIYGLVTEFDAHREECARFIAASKEFWFPDIPQVMNSYGVHEETHIAGSQGCYVHMFHPGKIDLEVTNFHKRRTQ